MVRVVHVVQIVCSVKHPQPYFKFFRAGTNCLYMKTFFTASLLLISLACFGQGELEKKVIRIFQDNCAISACHAGPTPQMGMDLGPEAYYASTVGEPATENPSLQRVNPGHPELSYLVKKIKGEAGIIGMQMPFGKDPLSSEEIQTIEDWVKQLDGIDQARKTKKKIEREYPFLGFRNLNLPSTRTLAKNTGSFAINHRFNPTLGDGFDAFFGLDGSAIIFIQLGYGITDDMSVWLGRTNASDNIELNFRHQVFNQGEGKLPFNLSWQGTVNWVAEAPSDPDDSRFRSEVLKYTLQVSASRKFGDQFSVLLVPGILFNPDEDVDGEDPYITLGLGGRWNFHNHMSVFAEWVPVLSGFELSTTFGNLNRFDSWGTGFEIATGGHVFQILLTNSVGLATDQYIRGGDLDPEDFFSGDIRLGFNISRVLKFRSKSKS